MRKVSAVLLGVFSISAAALADPADAQQPSGWIGNGHTSAYTLRPGEFELSGHWLRVDDTLDVLDLREEVLRNNNRLTGNSGDLDGSRGHLRVGIWRGMELFYSRQQQDLTLKVAPSARADVADLDEQLQTTSTAWGGKFVFYETANPSPQRPWTSAAVQVKYIENETDDFGGYLESLRFDANINIRLDPPQRFSLDRLQDDGWQAQLILSHGLGNRLAISYWAGYGEQDSSSGTSTEIEQASLRDAFLQTFDVSEQVLTAGVSLNWQITQRLPLQIGYEYIRIQDREAIINSSDSPLVPGFLRGGNLTASADNNHTLYGSLNWWVSPHIYAGITGKLYRNQYTGIMPHYNNPLSGSFSDITYGHLELSVGVRFAAFQ
ncbi:MAG: hypothetical protein CMQ34_06730 [Gammaproteobacteria bacterium]|nr:hypothetical protein [Gammaproteobacteria bacterium]|tara:strand:+ start:1543 stop:2676 length:1134 start_codon:yes stop_codon:yes gene_type:complete